MRGGSTGVEGDVERAQVFFHHGSGTGFREDNDRTRFPPETSGASGLSDELQRGGGSS